MPTIVKAKQVKQLVNLLLLAIVFAIKAATIMKSDSKFVLVAVAAIKSCFMVRVECP